MMIHLCLVLSVGSQFILGLCILLMPVMSAGEASWKNMRRGGGFSLNVSSIFSSQRQNSEMQ